MRGVLGRVRSGVAGRELGGVGIGGGGGPLGGTPSVWDGEVLEWGGGGCCMELVF